MSNSLSDQLLKAGLVTQEQVNKAVEDKKKPRAKPSTSRNKPNKAKRTHPNQKQNTQAKPSPDKAKSDDLEKYYDALHAVERKEKEEENRKKREAAARKKRTRKQIRELIEGNTLNQEGAEERYNFVVGSTIKYVYVTAEQQKQLANGELAITFIDGRRCLIKTEIGQQIIELDPDKVVVFASADDELDIPEQAEADTATNDQDSAS